MSSDLYDRSLQQNPEQQPQQQATISLNDQAAELIYANFCRISSTPEEVILDLAFNPNLAGDVVLNIKHRVVLNHYTAKRLLAALSLTLQRHEQAFGVLETDFRKRLVGQPQQ